MHPLHLQHLIDKSDLVAPIILLLFLTLSSWVESRPPLQQRQYDKQEKELIKFLSGKQNELA